jgi:hypothetical protein
MLELAWLKKFRKFKILIGDLKRGEKVKMKCIEM